MSLVLVKYKASSYHGAMETERDERSAPLRLTRRQLAEAAGIVTAAWGVGQATGLSAQETDQPPLDASGKVIPGFEEAQAELGGEKV
ncbi:MAG: hypothetical protein ACI82F_004262 [Planctomycetota bacterium]